MTERIIRINPLTSPLWMDFIANHPRSTIFHHPLWLSLLNGQYDYSPMAYCLTDEEAGIRAGIPFLLLRRIHTGKCLISLPFTDYCSPLYDDEDSLRTLLKPLACMQNENGFSRIEIRSFVPEMDRAVRHEDFVLHSLNLMPDPDSVFRAFRKTQVQQPIRKAEREGVAVRLDRSRIGIDIFYKLHVTTRRRLGAPVQPKSFFNLLWRHLIRNNLGFVLLAFMENTPISGAVFLTYNSTITYKYSASEPDYLRHRPNNLVLWKAIEWGCLNGYTTFDFGRSQVTNTGLRKFKGGWGAVEKPLPYSFISDSNMGTRKSSPVLETVAKKVIQNTPTFVCRTIGELLYKYFG